MDKSNTGTTEDLEEFVNWLRNASSEMLRKEMDDVDREIFREPLQSTRSV
jgi:hypothetical protein